MSSFDSGVVRIVAVDFITDNVFFSFSINHLQMR